MKWLNIKATKRFRDRHQVHAYIEIIAKIYITRKESSGDSFILCDNFRELFWIRKNISSGSIISVVFPVPSNTLKGIPSNSLGNISPSWYYWILSERK